ncbi:MAG: MFS transporter [Bacteroidetes bacterium]|nr:MFS transporter [Bacteroidota bacterium]
MNYLSQRRVALGALFFFMGICFASWAARIPDIQAKFQLSEGELGTLLLCLPIGSMLGLPIAGWSVHHYGSRIVILICGFAYALTLPLIGLASSPWLIAPILVCFGLLGNIMNISLNTQALGFEDQLGKSILASFHGVWSMAGFTAAGLGAGMIFFQFSPAAHYVVVTLLSVVIILFSKKYVTNDKREEDAVGGLVLKKPDQLLLRLGIISFLGMMAEGCMFDWSGVYFKKIVEAKPEFVSLGYVFFMGAMASGRFVTDKASNRYGKIPVLQVSGLLIFLGLLLAVLFPSLSIAALGFLLVGFGVASIVPVSYGIAGRSKLYSPSVALALVSTLSFFGFLAGPPLIGFIAEAFNLQVSFALIALNGIGILLLTSFSKQVFHVQENTVGT